MIPKKAPQGKFRFRLIGGALQLRIDDADSLNNVLVLDEAFWAMTGASLTSLRFDRRFLELIDRDGDGHIRCTEVKEAVKFLLDNLSDVSGILEGSDRLSVAALDPAGANYGLLSESFRLIMLALNKKAEDTLGIDEIFSYRNTSGFSSRNGDGIIAPDDAIAPELQTLVGKIIASGRTSTDRSGVPGVSKDNITAFDAAVKARLAHLAAQDAAMVFGADTPALYALFKECEPWIDGYFLNAAAAGFLTGDPARTGKMECAADLMVPDMVRKVLETAVAALPESSELNFSATLNPLCADKLRKLAASPVLAAFCGDNLLSAENWQGAKAAFAPYEAWMKAAPADDGLAGFAPEELQQFSDGDQIAELLNLTELDNTFAAAVAGSELLLKIAILQRDMLEFLNNFVSMPDLFSTGKPSRLQMGKLIMDGRHFTLTMPVVNVAEHKRIVQSSDICVLYVEISRTVAGKPEKQLLAVAVTGGTMRTLFVGKHGVFLDTDGNLFDARITDMVDQPVSIGEALKDPYFRFADFIGKQTEKMFNSRNAVIQKDLTKNFDPAAISAKPGTPAGTPAAGGSLPMLLMGGGIGVAALGSSVAFIAKSLQNVSFWTIVAVLAGIMVIFGGPMVVVSLVKLYRRNLSRFLESCGCAINRPMRLTRRMGAIFTFVPKRPKGEISLIDPAELLAVVPKRRKYWWKILLVIVLLLLGMAGGFAVRYYCCRPAACPAAVKKADGVKPAETAAPAAKPAAQPAAQSVKVVPAAKPAEAKK